MARLALVPLQFSNTLTHGRQSWTLLVSSVVSCLCKRVTIAVLSGAHAQTC